jgi:hypothetical protein
MEWLRDLLARSQDARVQNSTVVVPAAGADAIAICDSVLIAWLSGIEGNYELLAEACHAIPHLHRIGDAAAA